MTELRTRIEQDLRSALKAGDKLRSGTLRMVLSELKYKEVEGDLEEKDVIAVLQKAAKMRQESATQFREGGRPELAEKEERELEMLAEYLPQKLSPEELERVVDELIAELGIQSKKDLGKLMREVMSRYQGRVDGKQVQALAAQRLA